MHPFVISFLKRLRRRIPDWKSSNLHKVTIKHDGLPMQTKEAATAPTTTQVSTTLLNQISQPGNPMTIINVYKLIEKPDVSLESQ